MVQYLIGILDYVYINISDRHLYQYTKPWLDQCRSRFWHYGEHESSNGFEQDEEAQVQKHRSQILTMLRDTAVV